MRRILTAILAIISIQAYSQVSVSDSLSTERFQVRNGAIRGTYPKASAYVDVNTSGLVAIRQLGSDRIIVNYQAANLYVINGANTATLDSAVSWLGDVIGLEYCCSGGGGGSSVGLNTFQFSDGNGGFYQLTDTIIDEGDTIILYAGVGNGLGSIDIGVGNNANGVGSFALGFGNTANGFLSTVMGQGNTANGVASFVLGASNTANGNFSTVMGVGNVVNGASALIGGIFADTTASDPEIPQPTDVLFAMGNGSDDSNRSNAITLNRNGNLTTTAAFANTAYWVDDTPGGFTIPDNKYLAVYDPASLQANATITLPANPIDGQIQVIAFGGAITSGTVVTTLTLATTGGQTINVGTAAATGTIEQPLTFMFLAPLNKWYLISK